MPEAQDLTTKRVVVPMEPEARASLETKVSDKMSAIFGDGDDTLTGVEETSDGHAPRPETKEAEAPAKAAKEPEPKEKEETEVEPTEAEAAASEAADKPAVVAKPASTLPAAYVRSLKAYQWTDDEIAEGTKANPEGFHKMAERVHAQRVQQTQQWADLGRQAKAAAPATTVAEPQKFTPVDVKALRAKYGNEAFIDQMEAQSKALEYLQNQALPFIEQSRARQQEQELASLNKSIDGFFTGDDLKPYAEHYGKAGSSLTDAQVGARMKVLETADLLVRGAKATGRPITLDEAMTMAHDAVSSPIAVKVAVKKVQTAVQQRQSSISVRPGSRAASPVKGDRKALETTVKGKLATIFK